MEYVSAAVKAATGFILAVWVGIGEAVQFLLIFMVLDFATGLLAASKRRELSSDVSFDGLQKKGLVLCLVAAAHLVTDAAHIEYDLGAVVAIAYTIHELISITENCAKAGVWVPPPLVKFLAKAKEIGGWDGTERRAETRSVTTERRKR